MELLISISLTVGAALGGIMLGLLKDEAAAWLPDLTCKIISLAVIRMLPADKARYREEYASHVSQYPGKLGQLVQAIRCLIGGQRMSPPPLWMKIRLIDICKEAVPMAIGGAIGAASYKWPELLPLLYVLYVLVGIAACLVFGVVASIIYSDYRDREEAKKQLSD